MVELLLDRGADLEANDGVSAAAVCVCCAPGGAGRHGRAERVGGGGDVASGRGASVAGGRACDVTLAGRVHVGRGAMVRRGAVTCGRATSQYGHTALVGAASGGHNGTVELLLGRGADSEAKNIVNLQKLLCLPCVWSAYTLRIGCNGQVLCKHESWSQKVRRSQCLPWRKK